MLCRYPTNIRTGVRQRQPCMAGLREELGFKRSAGFSWVSKGYKVSGSTSIFCVSAWPHLRVSQAVQAGLGEHQTLPGLWVSMNNSIIWEIRGISHLLSITCVFPWTQWLLSLPGRRLLKHCFRSCWEPLAGQMAPMHLRTSEIF